jgi:hypothetical protein
MKSTGEGGLRGGGLEAEMLIMKGYKPPADNRCYRVFTESSTMAPNTMTPPVTVSTLGTS